MSPDNRWATVGLTHMPPQAISLWTGTAKQPGSQPSLRPCIPLITVLTEADKRWRSRWPRWKSAKINALGDMKALFVSAGPAVCVGVLG